MRISLILAILLLLINIVCDIYIAKQLPASFRKGLKRGLLWSFNAMCYAIYLAFMLLIYSKFEGILSSNIEVVVFIFILLSFPKLVFVVISPFDYVSKLFIKERTKFFTKFATLLAIITVLLLLFGAIFGRKNLVCNRVEISSSMLPESFDGYRVVHISDLHLKSLYGDSNFISEMVEMINSCNPDIVCITGDLVSLTADELLPFKDALSKIEAKDGVFSVLGNHDYGDYYKWSSAKKKRDNMRRLLAIKEEMGWQVLNNQHQMIYRQTDSIAVVGVENWGKYPFKQYGDLKLAYNRLNDEMFKILLSHNPSHWQEVVEISNIPLTLAGHTHSMQLKFPWLDGYISPASLTGDWWSGLYNDNGQWLYVNDGIGCTLFSFRFGAFPEVTLITINHDE